eukprot:354728-Chlamydomonas_euryale.AAC.8
MSRPCGGERLCTWGVSSLSKRALKNTLSILMGDALHGMMCALPRKGVPCCCGVSPMDSSTWTVLNMLMRLTMTSTMKVLHRLSALWLPGRANLV